VRAFFFFFFFFALTQPEVKKKKTLTQPSPAKAGEGLQPNEKGRPVARAALIVDAPGAVD
jgi:hypothetical protein